VTAPRPQDRGTPEVLLKPADVARRLQVSRSWVYSRAHDGRLPSLRLGGPNGPLRFVAEDVEVWLEEARTAWTPGSPAASKPTGEHGRASNAALEGPHGR
jgi:excisionase family DNA binding protein